jgi:hypothetical protein
MPIDERVRRCVSAGLRPLAIVYLPPPWANATGRGVPTDLPAWDRFCYECVKRYGPQGTFWQENSSLTPYPVTVYEIGNEPNLWTPDNTWRGTYTEYASMFQVAANAIRRRATEVGQHVDVIIGGLAAIGNGNQFSDAADYLDLIKPLIPNPPDAVGFHPYGFNQYPNPPAPSATAAYDNTSGRLKNMVLHLSQMGWSSVGLDITEDGIPTPDYPPPPASPSFPQYPESPTPQGPGRYDYFRNTVINIKNTYQTSTPPVRRYSVFTWSTDPLWNIAYDDAAYTLRDAGNGYRDGING